MSKGYLFRTESGVPLHTCIECLWNADTEQAAENQSSGREMERQGVRTRGDETVQ